MLCFGLLALLFSLAAALCDTQRTFNIQVGFTNGTLGVSFSGFYPSNFTIHTGDTVVFTSPSLDPHTVTFDPMNLNYPFVVSTPPPYNNTPYQMPNSPAAQNPFVAFTILNGNLSSCGTRGAPACVYDGTGYTNSGVLSTQPGPFTTTFTIQFTNAGSLTIIDAVFDVTATINIVPFTDASNNCIIIPTPAQVTAAGDAQFQVQLADIPNAYANANNYLNNVLGQFGPSNDGFITYNVLTGWTNVATGVTIQKFFPPQINVRPGDVLNYVRNGAAPHVVTFSNGAPLNSYVTPAVNTCCIGPTFGPRGITCNSTTPNTLPFPFSNFPCNIPIMCVNVNLLLAQDPTVIGGSAFAPYQFRSTQLGSTGYYTSGQLNPPPAPQARDTYQFKVNFTGTIAFQCELHVSLTMQGSVTSTPPTATPPPVYHVTQYSTQFDGPGACTSRQQIGSYTLVPNVCRRIGMTFPFYMYFKATPANGPPSSNVTGATYVHLMRWDLFNALPDCGLGPAITPPAVNCLVPLDGTCTVCHKDVQYRITLASGLVPSAVWLLVALALALTMV